MTEPRIRFKKNDGSTYPDLQSKLIKDVMIERHQLSILSDNLQQLSFTIEEGVINPESKKTNKRDFLMKDKTNKKFAITEIDDIIYNPANIKFGAIHRNKYGRGGVSPIYAIFKPLENPAYLEYYVQRKSFITKAMRYLEGSVEKLKSLKPDDFLKCEIHLPCLEEQKVIVKFLSQVDELIKYSEQEIEKLEILKKGLLKKVFLQETRFKNNDGDDYPDWKITKLKEVADFYNGDRSSRYPKDSDFVQSGICFLNTENLHNATIDINKKCKYITQEKYQELSGAKIELNDTIYCLRGSVGICSLNDILIEGTIASSLMVIRAKKGAVDPIYMYYVLNSPEVIKQVNQCFNGSCAGNLSAKDVSQFEIYIPHLEEQVKIAEFFMALDKNILYAKKEHENYIKLKKGLLQNMFV